MDYVTCDFSLPSSGPPARLCLPDSLINSKYLSQNKLEAETNISLEMEEYMSIATRCHSVPVQPVELCQNIILKISTVLYAMAKALTASFLPIYTGPHKKGKIHVSAFIHIVPMTLGRATLGGAFYLY